MKLYRFITGPDTAAMCHRVTAALNAGWELHGSPALTFNQTTGETYAGQAVVKDVPGHEYTPDTKLSDY